MSALCLLQFIAGCMSAKGKKVFSPGRPELPGYSVANGKFVFRNGPVMFTVIPVTTEDLEKSHPFFAELPEYGFTLFRMEIYNNSEDNVIYNPAFTALLDRRMEYSKPMDYTDMYDLLRARVDAGTILSQVEGRFYDLAVTVKPGENVSRLLIFRRFEEERGRAELRLEEVYVGTNTISMVFPFVLKPSVEGR